MSDTIPIGAAMTLRMFYVERSGEPPKRYKQALVRWNASYHLAYCPLRYPGCLWGINGQRMTWLASWLWWPLPEDR